MYMKIIGVTGGIGSGKSTVSSFLKEMGAVVIDADLLSHKVTKAGNPAHRKIVEVFGQKILDSSKEINRKKIAEIVFNDKSLLKKLENIVHAEVTKCIRKTLTELKKQGYKGLVVLDVPIPVKNGFLDTVDTVWVVWSPEETRIKRVMKRSGLSREEAVKRINSQFSQDEYIRLADVVIYNDQSLEELKSKVKNLVLKFL
jgi:dephospho-CoA kinase